jgi:hypothetical protein
LLLLVLTGLQLKVGGACETELFIMSPGVWIDDVASGQLRAAVIITGCTTASHCWLIPSTGACAQQSGTAA